MRFCNLHQLTNSGQCECSAHGEWRTKRVGLTDPWENREAGDRHLGRAHRSYTKPVSHSLFISCLRRSIASTPPSPIPCLFHASVGQSCSLATIIAATAVAIADQLRTDGGYMYATKVPHETGSRSLGHVHTNIPHPARLSLAHYLLHAHVSQSSYIDITADVNMVRTYGWQHRRA